MKQLLLILLLIVSSICFSQTVIEKNKLQKYVGEAGTFHIYNNSFISVENLDANRLISFLTILYHQHNIKPDKDEIANKKSFCTIGYSKILSIIITYHNSVLEITIDHKTEKGKKQPSAEEETKIRDYQIFLTEQIIKEIKTI